LVFLYWLRTWLLAIAVLDSLVFAGLPKPKPKTSVKPMLSIPQSLVSERRKLWQKDELLSVSPLTSVDSANMNEQERLADFDTDSAEGNTTEEEPDVTRSASDRKVCVTIV